MIGLIIATNLIDKRNYDQLSGALETIYSDRLIAKNLIFDMSNLVHEKSIAIALNDSTFYLKRNIEINDRMNNLLDDYAHTSLTTNESAEFEPLKRDISKLIQIENKVNEATTNRESIVALHAKIRAGLEKLSTIQIEEGKKQVLVGRTATRSINLFTQIEIYMFIFLAVIFQILLLSGLKWKKSKNA